MVSIALLRLFSLPPGLSLRFVLLLYRRLNEDTRSARLSQMPPTGPSPLRVWIFRVVSVVVVDGEERNE